MLGLIAAVQAALLVLVGLAGEHLARGAFLAIALAELMLGVAVLAVTPMALGLVVSACVRSAETTLTMLVLLSIGQVMLSGAVLPLGSGPKQWISYAAPAQWGFAATASTVNLKTLLPPHSTTETLWSTRQRPGSSPGHAGRAGGGIRVHRLAETDPDQPRPRPAAGEAPRPRPRPRRPPRFPRRAPVTRLAAPVRAAQTTAQAGPCRRVLCGHR